MWPRYIPTFYSYLMHFVSRINSHPLKLMGRAFPLASRALPRALPLPSAAVRLERLKVVRMVWDREKYAGTGF